MIQAQRGTGRRSGREANGRQIRAVLWKVMGLNLAVALAKLLYGLKTGAISMVADGYHSLLDSSSNVIGLVGIWIAYRPPDASHPYGHRKFEPLAAMGISFLLFTACYQILKSSLERLRSPQEPVVTLLSFVVMLATMAVNLFVTTYERRKGRELGSTILLADALHTKSDLYTSSLVLLALLFSRLGYPWADVGAAIVVTVFIAKAAYEIIDESLQALADASRIAPELIALLVRRMPGVLGCHRIRTRGVKDHVHVDLTIEVDPTLAVPEAHRIADQVEAMLVKAGIGIVDVVVHIEPLEKGRGSG